MTRALSPFGARLRQWRSHRGLSQLELASRVATTPRHVSFLETGRSRPSRQMVLRLGDALDLPLRDRNDLLHAAGLGAAYPEAELSGHDLAPYRSAIAQLLQAHDPYPATVVDAHWNIVAANRASLLLFGEDAVGSNIVRRFVAEPAAAQRIVNWPEVAWASLLAAPAAGPQPVRHRARRSRRAS
jgi:transcriptional regulator with XRE-family HTH domain